MFCCEFAYKMGVRKRTGEPKKQEVKKRRQMTSRRGISGEYERVESGLESGLDDLEGSGGDDDDANNELEDLEDEGEKALKMIERIS